MLEALRMYQLLYKAVLVCRDTLMIFLAVLTICCWVLRTETHSVTLCISHTTQWQRQLVRTSAGWW